MIDSVHLVAVRDLAVCAPDSTCLIASLLRNVCAKNYQN